LKPSGLTDISARLDRLPATRAVWRLVALLSLGFFFEIYALMFAGYVAPGIVASGILTPTTSGVFGTRGVASFIAALFSGLFVATAACGFLADTYGRRAIFTYSLLWYSAATLIMAFQTTAFGLQLWGFVAGLGVGVEIITIGTYLTELSPKYLRGRAFAVCQAVGFCAVPVVAFLSYALVPRAPFGYAGWRWVIAIGALGSIFVWWIRRRLPESPRWLAQQGREDEADRILSALESDVQRESGRPLSPVPPAERTSPRGQLLDMWRPPYRNRTVMLVVFNVFQTVGYYGFASWVPTLLITQGITATSSLLYTSVIALAAPLGPLIGFFIADKFERKTVIVAMALGNIVCGIIFSHVRSAFSIILMGVSLTLVANIISYSFHAYQQELFPTAIRARAAGFVYSWSRFSAIFNAFIIAFILGRSGMTGVFVFIAAAMAGVAIVIGAMGPRTRNIALEKI
jgi:putative MFS transporter